MTRIIPATGRTTGAVLGGLAALALSCAPALAQEAEAQPQPQAESAAPRPDQLTLPVIDGVRAAPDCGGLYGLAGRAQCMMTALSRLGAVVEVYTGALTQTGWTWVGGRENQVVLQRPDQEGCDTLEMIAFYDVSLPEEALPDAPGYLGFALRTGDQCRAEITPTPAAPQE